MGDVFRPGAARLWGLRSFRFRGLGVLGSGFKVQGLRVQASGRGAVIGLQDEKESGLEHRTSVDLLAL